VTRKVGSPDGLALGGEHALSGRFYHTLGFGHRGETLLEHSAVAVR
jgi:hypothetical protein